MKREEQRKPTRLGPLAMLDGHGISRLRLLRIRIRTDACSLAGEDAVHDSAPCAATSPQQNWVLDRFDRRKQLRRPTRFGTLHPRRSAGVHGKRKATSSIPLRGGQALVSTVTLAEYVAANGLDAGGGHDGSYRLGLGRGSGCRPSL